MPNEKLVRTLFDARRLGQRVEPTHDIASPREALASQLGVRRLFVDELNDSIAGWKVGMTSGASRDRMGPGFRPFGFVLESRCKASEARVRLGGDLPHVIEPEICLIVGSALQGQVDAHEARDAVRAVAAAFEIGELRANPAHASNELLIADGLANWGIVVGESIAPSQFDGPTPVELRFDDEPIARAVPGTDVVMDDPFHSLARLINLLSRFGLGVLPGDRVITGSFVTRPAAAGRWTAAFDRVGRVSVEIQ